MHAAVRVVIEHSHIASRHRQSAITTAASSPQASVMCPSVCLHRAVTARGPQRSTQQFHRNSGRSPATNHRPPVQYSTTLYCTVQRTHFSQSTALCSIFTSTQRAPRNKQDTKCLSVKTEFSTFSLPREYIIFIIRLVHQ